MESNTTEWEQLQSSVTTFSTLWGAKTLGQGVTNRIPVENNVYIISFEIFCFVIGLPLNLNMVWSIVTRETLNCSPRNMFVLGISVSSLAAFIQPMIEVIHFFAPSDLTCRVYAAVLSLPDCFLLMNIFLSLIDRYVALEYPLWHHSKMTVKMGVGVIIACFFLIIGLCKFVYIAQLVPLECKIVIIERMIMSWTLIVLFFLCLATRVMVYFQTKRILRKNYLLAVHVAPKKQANCCYSWLLKMCRHQNNRNLNDGPVQVQTEHPQLSEEAISRLEWDATKVLAFGVTSLLVLSFPLVAFFLFMFICRTWFDATGLCNRFSWLGGYFKQFAQVHGIYHPIMYMAWNKEFFTVPAFCIKRQIDLVDLVAISFY